MAPVGKTGLAGNFAAGYFGILQQQDFGFFDAQFVNPFAEGLIFAGIDINRQIFAVCAKPCSQQVNRNSGFGKSLVGHPFFYLFVEYRRNALRVR